MFRWSRGPRIPSPRVTSASLLPLVMPGYQAGAQGRVLSRWHSPVPKPLSQCFLTRTGRKPVYGFPAAAITPGYARSGSTQQTLLVQSRKTGVPKQGVGRFGSPLGAVVGSLLQVRLQVSGGGRRSSALLGLSPSPSDLCLPHHKAASALGLSSRGFLGSAWVSLCASSPLLIRTRVIVD